MATLSTKKGKTGLTRYQIQFKVGKARKTLSLGSKYTVKQAEEIKSHVERIADAIEAGRDFSELPRTTKGFVEDMSDDLKARFKDCGLLTESRAPRLGRLWDMFEGHAAKMGFKDSTVRQYQTARKWFFRYFKEEQQFDTVTEKDAEEFNAWVHRQKNKYGKPISPRSVAGYLKTIKAVFNLARKARLLDRSPFEFIKKGSFANPARQFEVSLEMISDILDACPSQGWRTLFAFWRFGGLRKMEPLLLKWEDILWQAGKIRVHSPKTERYEGHAERICPLFPEIRRELEDLFEVQGSPAGDTYVLPDDIRERSENGIYNAVIRIIKRAGYTPWDRLINNMRSTRVSELVREGRSEKARKAWFGHSEKVSEKHYQQEDMLIGKEEYDWACSFQTLPTEQVGKTTAETTAEPCKIG